MRSAYGAQLGVLTEELAEMCRLAGNAMQRATRSLLDCDLILAEEVIDEHSNIVSAGMRVEETGLSLLMRQAPMARDLRAIVGAVQLVADIERMGVLARHVAEIARRRHPDCAIPAVVTNDFADMGHIAADLAGSAYQVIASCDLGRARYIRDADDAMDHRNRHLLTVVTHREWKHGTSAAVDVTLLARYYERFADHAVEIARRVIFQATGQAGNEKRILAY